MLPKTLIVGCGERQIKQVKNCIAIDISEVYIKKSKRLKPNNYYLLADANNLPFINKVFDEVICTEVLEHTKNPDYVLFEISRVINTNGTLCLSVPLAKACKYFAEIFPVYKRDFYDGYHKSNFTEKLLIQLLKKNKFKSLKLKYFGEEIYYFWYIWAKIVKLFNLDIYIEESGKICLNSNNFIKRVLFRNLSRGIKVFSLSLSKILSNKRYTNIFVEARK